MFENRIVIDSEWEPLERQNSEPEEERTEDCYLRYKGKVFETESDAFKYALSECLCGSEEDKRDFKDMLLEWFFSNG